MSNIQIQSKRCLKKDLFYTIATYYSWNTCFQQSEKPLVNISRSSKTVLLLIALVKQLRYWKERRQTSSHHSVATQQPGPQSTRLQSGVCCRNVHTKIRDVVHLKERLVVE